MSLINETINNLKDKKSENKHKKTARIRKFPPLLLIFGLAFALFVDIKFFGFSKYFFHSYKTWTNRGGEELVTLPVADQAQYYHAINALNEGKVKQATIEFKNFLEKYPNFSPAKKIYLMLVED